MAHARQLVSTVLPRLATGLSTLVVIQPGSYEQREGQEAAEFSTRNGWAELKEALAQEGTVDCAPLSLSAAAASSAGSCSGETQSSDSEKRRRSGRRSRGRRRSGAWSCRSWRA